MAKSSTSIRFLNIIFLIIPKMLIFEAIVLVFRSTNENLVLIVRGDEGTISFGGRTDFVAEYTS